MTTITITFRAKRDTFAGGEGYKVPKLAAQHVTASDRGILATTILDLIARGGDASITRARLKRFAQLDLPGVVWVDGHDSIGNENDPRWVISPRGDGFMADLTLTAELSR